MITFTLPATTEFPTGSSSYTWATGQFTSPTLNGWSQTPGTAVAGQNLYIARQVYSDSLATTPTAITWNTTTATNITPVGSSGISGQRVGFLELYIWSATQPTTFPGGTSSTYTWSTGVFSAPGTPSGWLLTPGASVADRTLWGISMYIVDSTTSAQTNVTWNSTTVYPIAVSSGSNSRTAILDLYRWYPTVPTNFPSTLVVTVDRNPSISRKVRLLEEKVDYNPLSISRFDGENAVTKMLDFKMASLPIATAKRVIEYFKSLKGSKTMVVSEDGTNVNYKVVSWNVTLDSSLYATITVSCEEHFNA